MKFCKKCLMVNEDSQQICGDCGESLRGEKSLNQKEVDELYAIYSKKYNSKQKNRKMFFYCILLSIYSILVIMNFVYCKYSNFLNVFLIIMVSLLLFISFSFGYFKTNKTIDLHFKYDHYFNVKNVKNAEPTDFYRFRIHIKIWLRYIVNILGLCGLLLFSIMF